MGWSGELKNAGGSLVFVTGAFRVWFWGIFGIRDFWGCRGFDFGICKGGLYRAIRTVVR